MLRSASQGSTRRLDPESSLPCLQKSAVDRRLSQMYPNHALQRHFQNIYTDRHNETELRHANVSVMWLMRCWNTITQFRSSWGCNPLNLTLARRNDVPVSA